MFLKVIRTPKRHPLPGCRKSDSMMLPFEEHPFELFHEDLVEVHADKELPPTWTATQVRGYMRQKYGEEVALAIVGRVAKQLGLQCEQSETENEYGYWTLNVHESTVHGNFPQFNYNRKAVDLLVAGLLKYIKEKNKKKRKKRRQR